VPLVPGRYHLGVPEAVAAIDENTIGVVAIMGSTMDGSYEPVADLAAALDTLAATPGAPDVPIHVDAASGGFVAPFLQPEIEWDFRLGRVASINSSGHKYGLVYPGVGWVIWARPGALPEDLVFKGQLPRRGDADVRAELLPARRAGRGAVLQLPAPRYSGYKNVQQTAQDIALHLSGEISKLGPFELLSDGRTCRSSRVQAARRRGQVLVFDISNGCGCAAGRFPAYTFLRTSTDMAVIADVIRNGFSMDLANCSSLLQAEPARLTHPQSQMPPELQKSRSCRRSASPSRTKAHAGPPRTALCWLPGSGRPAGQRASPGRGGARVVGEGRVGFRRDLVARTGQGDVDDLGHHAGDFDIPRRDRPGRRLVDVVGDEDDRDAELLADAQDQVLKPEAALRVHRRERLVHEQQSGR